MRNLTLLLAILASTFFMGCKQDDALGTKNNPVKLYFTPSVDADTIASNSDDFIKFLEKELDFILRQVFLLLISLLLRHLDHRELISV